ASSGNAGHVDECHCENDWGDYHSGACESTSVTAYVKSTYAQQYTALCGPGQKVQWGFFAYNSTTPGDSSIVFEVHTADSAAALGPPLKKITTAKASPNTQIC